MSESTPPKKPDPKPLDPQRLLQLIVEIDAALELAWECPEKDGDGFYFAVAGGRLDFWTWRRAARICKMAEDLVEELAVVHKLCVMAAARTLIESASASPAAGSGSRN